MQRIGVLAGTFDPVHIGHVSFARNAVKGHKLNKVYFLVERKPRNKKNVTDFTHRTEMLERALETEDALELIKMPEVSFNMHETLANLKRRFPKTELVFLFGSDVADGISNWEKADKLAEIIVALKGQESKGVIKKRLEGIGIKVHFMKAENHKISSSDIRKGRTTGLSKKVADYIKNKQLYNYQK